MCIFLILCIWKHWLCLFDLVLLPGDYEADCHVPSGILAEQAESL